MPRPGKETEELVEALEASVGKEDGVEVKSPDYIPDRDTGEPREVDVAVRIKSGSHRILIILECRDRQGAQDVTWIEQLATKRASVGADKAIAVSTSGFTGPAQKKAVACMVELRTVREFKGISAAALLQGFPITVAMHNPTGLVATLHVGPEDDTAEYNDLAAVKKRDGVGPLFEAQWTLHQRAFSSEKTGGRLSMHDLMGRPPLIEAVFSAKSNGEQVHAEAVYGQRGDFVFVDTPQGRKRLLAIEGEITVSIEETVVVPKSLHVYAGAEGSIAGAAMYEFREGGETLAFRAILRP